MLTTLPRALVLALLAAASFAPSISFAQTDPNVQSFDTGQSLMATCEKGETSTLDDLVKAFNAGGCIGYISGVADALEAVRALRGRPPCIPEGVTKSTLTDLVLKYLADNPQERHGQAAGIIIVALYKAYPSCRA